MHDGEVSLLAGLTNQQDSKQLTGIPGLASIPLLGKLFSGESVDHQRNELMIVLIPHIVRSPEITAQNLRSIAVGNQQTIRLNFAPKNSDVMSGQAAAAAMKGNVPPPANAMPQAGTAPAVNQPAAATANPPATAPAAPPATAPPLAAPGMPPATAPPTAGPPATAPPAAPSPADQPAPAGEAHVLFSPAQVETRIGSPVAVSVMIDNGVDVASAPLQVQFDPRVLKLNDVTRGDFLASDGQQPVFTKNVLNESGLATIQLNRQPGTPGVNGGGVLVILNFQTVSRGVTRVNLPNLIVRNSKGQPVATGNPQLSITVQ
jgi:general secretion pathway protein D